MAPLCRGAAPHRASLGSTSQSDLEARPNIGPDGKPDAKGHNAGKPCDNAPGEPRSHHAAGSSRQQYHLPQRTHRRSDRFTPTVIPFANSTTRGGVCLADCTRVGNHIGQQAARGCWTASLYHLDRSIGRRFCGRSDLGGQAFLALEFDPYSDRRSESTTDRQLRLLQAISGAARQSHGHLRRDDRVRRGSSPRSHLTRNATPRSPLSNVLSHTPRRHCSDRLTEAGAPKSGARFRLGVASVRVQADFEGCCTGRLMGVLAGALTIRRLFLASGV
jgi:hypothetical protein